MGSLATSFQVASATNWPTGAVGSFFVVVDPGTSNEEKVLCSSRSGTTITVAPSGRGADGTTPVAHSVPAVAYPCWSATEADELNAHAAAATAVHGIAGSLVGTTDTQTLTNKTLNGGSNTFAAIPLAAITPAPQSTSTALTNLLAALVSTGFLTQTAANTFVERVLAATNSSGTALSVSNPAGVAGNPTYNLDPSLLTGIPQAGVTGLAAALAALQPLDADLSALAGLTATAGMLSRTGANTFAVRSLTSADGSFAITNPTGAAGNPDVSATDTGGITTGFVAGANWAINNCVGRVLFGKIAFLYLNMANLTYDSTASSQGNLSDETMVTIPASLRPARDLTSHWRGDIVVSGSGTAAGSADIRATGAIVLTDAYPSYHITGGANVLLTATYFLGT